MQEEEGLRRRLRSMPSLAGDLPSFDPDAVPDDPVALFMTWFDEAVDAGVPEPHAVVVATSSPDGLPSARVVVLDDVVDGAWHVATDLRSHKAQDLGANPQAALCFYWQPQGRQVRVRGAAHPLAPRRSAEDFLSRSPASRAAALATSPGEPMGAAGDMEQAMTRARARVDAEPGLVLAEWVVYAVVPHEVEFWQGRRDRAHTRVVYRRDAGRWTHRLVWP